GGGEPAGWQQSTSGGGQQRPAATGLSQPCQHSGGSMVQPAAVGGVEALHMTSGGPQLGAPRQVWAVIESEDGPALGLQGAGVGTGEGPGRVGRAGTHTPSALHTVAGGEHSPSLWHCTIEPSEVSCWQDDAAASQVTFQKKVRRRGARPLTGAGRAASASRRR